LKYIIFFGSELPSGRAKKFSADVSEVRAASIIRDGGSSELPYGMYCRVKNNCRPTFQSYLLPTIRAIIIALMMETARTSETSVDNYFTWQYIPEDKSELHTRRCENLKSHNETRHLFE
jgi:hypothetical protein